MPKWPRVSWDAGDLKQLSASLDHLDSNRKTYAKYKSAAKLPLLVLGAPGGWTFYPNLTFYGSAISLILLNGLPGDIAQLSILPVMMMVAIVSYAYGTIRDTKQSLIRLQVLRILRVEKESWTDFVVRPAITYLESLTEFKRKPGRIKRYLNDMRSLNRADKFFGDYTRALLILSLASGATFLFVRVALVALFFLISMVAWVAMIPISFAISAWADTTRNEIPKVWHVEDLRVLEAEPADNN